MIFLFEISDKILAIQDLYCFALILGGTGFLLGLFRTSFGTVWFVVPNLFVSLLIFSTQMSDINYFYKNVIYEMGETYILHNYISFFLSLLLNLTGILLGIFKKNRNRLK